MKYFKLFFLFVFSLIIIGCSSDDDNPASPQTSILKGTWSDSVKVSSQSLSTSLSIDESSGVVTGSGKISFIDETSSSKKEISFQTTAAGTFFSKDVVVSVTSEENKYTFTGKLSNDNSTMSGTAVLILKDNFFIDNGIYTFNINLKKK